MSNETPVSTAENPVQKPKKKTIKDILSIVINVVLIFAMILAALCTYVSFVSASGNGVPNLFGYEFFSVQTDSMYPTLKSGDLIIDRVMDDPSELRPRDIITYWTVINGERVLNTHRINQIYDGGNYLVFETKGDKNDVADSLMVHESEIVGKYVTHISGVGKILDYLQTSTGFLIVIVLPVAIFFLFHLIQFFRVLFEYQNVKNRLKYYDELGAQGIVLDPKGVATPKKDVTQDAPADAPVDKSQIEAELREKIKAEMMAEMLAELRRQNEVIAAMEKEKAAASEAAPAAEFEAAEDSAPAEQTHVQTAEDPSGQTETTKPVEVQPELVEDTSEPEAEDAQAEEPAEQQDETAAEEESNKE